MTCCGALQIYDKCTGLEKFSEHEDGGQMNMYMGCFVTEENMPNDNSTIDIILSKYVH